MERILASGIESAYGRKNVLMGVDLAADAGQCVGIVGANGCGKSTLLNILAGLRDAKTGNIFFDGQRAEGRAARRLFQSYTGYVPQENNLIPELSVKDNLLIWYRDRRLLARELQEGFLRILGDTSFYISKEAERFCLRHMRRATLIYATGYMLLREEGAEK